MFIECTVKTQRHCWKSKKKKKKKEINEDTPVYHAHGLEGSVLYDSSSS